MSFWEKANKFYNQAQGYMADQIEKQDRNLRQTLQKYSDEKIEKAYRNRYNNPNLSDYQRGVLEDEAHRRGIY